ncbi:MAG TPA: hypothetical protein VF161_07725 [Steroidobacteraceae bacterium]|jgi:hypothetical protein
MSIARVWLLAASICLMAGCSTSPSRRPAPPPATPVEQIPSVAGTWVLTIQSPMGQRDSETIFIQDGTKLSGRMLSSQGEVPLTGTLNGDAIAFGIDLKVQGRDLRIDYSGSVSGETMSGTVRFGAFADGKWTGRRKAE